MWTVLLEAWERGKLGLFPLLSGNPERRWVAAVGWDLLTMSFKLDFELFECEDETRDDNGDKR